MSVSQDVRGDSGTETVQESYDECDGDPTYVIADVTTDDAWLSTTKGQEVSVVEHR